jgi:hypothetical protein
MIRRLCLFSLLLLLPAARAAEPPAQWVIVTAPAFRDSIAPLCEQRKAQGMRVEVVQTSDVLTEKEILAADAGKLRERVNGLCREHKGSTYVLLVGAIEAGKLDAPATKVLPPLRGSAGRMKDQPSDNGYGCPGGDLLPSAAVGRFPARTAEECTAMVAKTLACERDTQPGAWRRQVTVLAGMPAFNPFVDKMVEGLAMARFEGIHSSWSGHAVYHNAQSRFCVPDDRLHDTALDLVQQGQAFTVYLGHSNARGLYAGRARYLDRDDWASVKIRSGPGVFVTFGCNGCQLAGRDGEGYGVAAIRNPGGPVAVTGSHGICFAAMVEVAADGLLGGLLTDRPPERLGDAWLRLKANLDHGPIDPLAFKVLDAVDGDARIPLADQRREHLEMFVLLGDPALKLPVLPLDVQLSAPRTIQAGAAVTIQGDLPERLAGAQVRLTLERPVSSEPADLEPLPATEGGARDRVMLANYDKANRFVLAEKVLTADGGHFEAALVTPARLPWRRLLVRAYASTDRAEGLGVQSLMPAK